MGANIMKSPYDVHFPTLIHIVCKRDKIYYFSSKNVISLMMVDQGKYVD